MNSDTKSSSTSSPSVRARSESNSASDSSSQSIVPMVSNLLFATYVVIVSAMMLIVNALMCLSAHSALTLFGPEWLTKNPNIYPRASQMFYFLAPVVLMVLEWNLLDRIQRLFNSEQQ